ncbi:MAG: glycosyltransferase family 9 protein [Bacteroidales bacterium]
MHLLVIRTSAMGDVALLTPVIMGMTKQYPDVEITLVTRKTFESFFYSFTGVKFFFPDFSRNHRGIRGIFRMHSDLKKIHADCVIDLHDVLRSKILRQLFRLSGLPVFVINKGRSDKRNVINGKRKTGLKHSVIRYCDVFAKAGYSVVPADVPCILPTTNGISEISGLYMNTGEFNIGVAPYARHKLKMWPEENMQKLLGMISARLKVKIWLFGGHEELERLKNFQKQVSGSFLVAGNLSLEGELALMSRLDLMISMDSSNMHLAALEGIRVISIWGGTDPLTGFGAWKQPENMAIRIPPEELSCRPCTIFGKGECRRGDLACMKWLTPERVFQKVIELIQ